MTITQTYEIPADHRITVEFPREVPTGATVEMECKIIPFPKKDEKQDSKTSPKLRITREMLREMRENCPDLKALTGILHTDMTVEQIKEERLAKYLK